MVQHIGELELRVLSCCLSYPGQPARRCLRSLCTARGRLPRIPLGHGPFLHGFRRWLACVTWLSTFVHPLPRYYSRVRLPRSVRVGITATGLLRPDRPRDARSAAPGISRFPCKELGTCPGSLTPRVRCATRVTRHIVRPSPPNHKVGNPNEVISELNSPACTPPVNASPPSSRMADA